MQSQEKLAQCLQALGVKHLVIGHQPGKTQFADGTVRKAGELFQQFDGLIQQFGFVCDTGRDVTPPQPGYDLILRFFTHFAVHVRVTPTFGTTTYSPESVTPSWVTIFLAQNARSGKTIMSLLNAGDYRTFVNQLPYRMAHAKTGIHKSRQRRNHDSNAPKDSTLA